MLYDFFNNPFTYYCGGPDLNLPPINIEDIPRPDKIAHYNPDMLPSDIYVASEKYVSTLTAPYDYTQLIVLTFDDNNPHHAMENEKPFHGRVKRG